MDKYYELINDKNKFLNLLIEKYCEDPKEGKKNFILSYLKTCSLFFASPYMIEDNIKGKNYYHCQTYIDEKSYNESLFEEANTNNVVDFVKMINTTTDNYIYDFIAIDTPNNKTFTFTIDEYESQNTFMCGEFIKDETWINHESNIDYGCVLPGYLSYDVINNSERYNTDSSFKLPKEEYKYIDLNVKPKELTVVGGRPAMGKSVTAINLLLNEIDKGGKALYLTLDKPAKTVAREILGIRAEISLHHASINKYTNDEYERVLKDLDKLNGIEIYECCHYNINEICHVIKTAPTKPTLVVIEDFQSIHYKDKYPKNEEEALKIAKQLKSLAKSLSISIVVTSKINRSIENRKNKRPKIKDIEGPKGLGDIADNIYMIYRDDYYAITNDERLPFEDMEIIDVKNKKTIKCAFERRRGMIVPF